MGPAVALERWLTGSRAGPDSSSLQVVVTQRPDQITPMIRATTIDGAATVYFRGEGAVGEVRPAVLAVHTAARAYRFSVLRTGGRTSLLASLRGREDQPQPAMAGTRMGADRV